MDGDIARQATQTQREAPAKAHRKTDDDQQDSDDNQRSADFHTFSLMLPGDQEQKSEHHHGD